MLHWTNGTEQASPQMIEWMKSQMAPGSQGEDFLNDWLDHNSKKGQPNTLRMYEWINGLNKLKDYELERIPPKRMRDDYSYRLVPRQPAPPPQVFQGKTAWKRIEPNEELRNIAHGYMANQGWGEYEPPQTYPDVDPERAKRIAEEYEKMKHDPNDPQVKASYEALMRETQAQYEYLLKNGYQMEFEPHEGAYNSPWEAIDDVRNNKHLYVYPTSAGFGDTDVPDHPLVQNTGYKWNGQPVTYNDLFRGVHDVFGHAKEGVGFRQDGEENAWRQHSAMYSEPARRALTSETRGQNSYVNFGPFAEHNQRANQEDTVYAPQKAGLMPEWTAYEGASDDDLPSTGYELPQDRSSTTVESSSTLDRASNWQSPRD
jgi:hypothetical protein